MHKKLAALGHWIEAERILRKNYHQEKEEGFHVY